MRKKEIIWIVVLLVLSGVYVHYFTHWSEKPQININASYRPSRHGGATVWPIVFTLNDTYKLTSVKVIPLEGTNFNPMTPPVWHLVSDSNSAPVRAFRYGQNISGMKPALKGVHPEALTPDVVYRLVVSADAVTGTTDFKAKAIAQ